MSALEIIGAVAVGVCGLVYVAGLLALALVVAHYELFEDTPVGERLAIGLAIAGWPLLAIWWAVLTAAELVRRALWWPR